MGFLTGDKGGFKQLSTQTGGQEQFFNQFLQNLMQQMGGGGQGGQGGQQGNYGQAQSYVQQMLSGRPEAYQNFAAPHMQNFQEQTIPRLAERFAGLGGGMGGGTLGSSGFGQAIGGAGAQLQSSLAGLYAQLQQQAAQQAFGNYNSQSGQALGTRAFENTYQPGTTGAIGGLLQGVGAGTGIALGATGGGALTSAFGKLFKS
ncbi:MAG TPA: hypothetical protein VIJ14_07960 [Rhabdochlamydiaceae bacterium]